MCAYIVALTKKDNFKLRSKFKQILSDNDIIFCKKVSTILLLAKKVMFLNTNSSYNININEDTNTVCLTLSSNLTNKDFIKKIIDDEISLNFYKYFNKNICFTI